jgi:hypothetical protein
VHTTCHRDWPTMDCGLQSTVYMYVEERLTNCSSAGCQHSGAHYLSQGLANYGLRSAVSTSLWFTTAPGHWGRLLEAGLGFCGTRRTRQSALLFCSLQSPVFPLGLRQRLWAADQVSFPSRLLQRPWAAG